MYKGKRVLTIIPARGGSKGLPNKNIKVLIDKPLVAWPITAALKSDYIDKIIVSTDSEEIAKIALQYGADVPYLRPTHLATDEASSFAVLEYHINEIHKTERERYDYVLMLEPTSPLTETIDIDRAIEKLINSENIADSLVGICKSESGHPSFSALIQDNGLIKPYEQDEFIFLRRQDISEVYFFSGSLYMSKIDALLTNKGFYHSTTIGQIDNKWKSLEIDDMIDFILVESILINKNLINKADE